MNSFKEQFNLFFSEAPPLNDSFLIPNCNMAKVDSTIISKIQRDLLAENHMIYFVPGVYADKVCYNYAEKKIYINDPIHFISTEAFYSCLLHEFGHFLGNVYNSFTFKTRLTLAGIPYFTLLKPQFESILIDELSASICSFRIAQNLKLDLDYSLFINILIRAFKGYWNLARYYIDEINIEYLLDCATEISNDILNQWEKKEIFNMSTSKYFSGKS